MYSKASLVALVANSTPQAPNHPRYLSRPPPMKNIVDHLRHGGSTALLHISIRNISTAFLPISLSPSLDPHHPNTSSTAAFITMISALSASQGIALRNSLQFPRRLARLAVFPCRTGRAVVIGIPLGVRSRDGQSQITCLRGGKSSACQKTMNCIGRTIGKSILRHR